jgi:hypothetical protein
VADALADLYANREQGYSTDAVKEYLKGIDPAEIRAYASRVHALGQKVDDAVASLTQLQATVATAVKAGETADAARGKLNVAITALTKVKADVHQFEAYVLEAAAKLAQAKAAFNGEAQVQPQIRRVGSTRGGGPQARTMAAQSQGRAAQGAAQNQPNSSPLADLIKSLTGSGTGSSTPAAAPAPAAAAPVTPPPTITPTTPTTATGYPYGGAVDPTTGLPVHSIQVTLNTDGSINVTSTPGVDPTTGQATDQSAEVTVLTQDPTTHQTVSHQVRIGADGVGSVVS